jgi:hypothetical protein
VAGRHVSFERARDFLYENGRVVERRLFATLFESAPADGGVDALIAYRNPDGGFGHALEPDKRCPDSQPLDVQVAFETCVAAGVCPVDVIRGACSFLESVTAPSGGVPIALPNAMNYPRAPHWSEISPEASVNPTAALAALLYQLQVEHPWRERATAYCFDELERAVPREAHAIRCVFHFLEWVPDQERAAALTDRVADALPTAEWFRSEPDDETYGVAPPSFAPTPQSPWRARFDDSAFDAHLDRLARDQQPDGGWPISWNAPGPAAELEWRGIETLRAIRILDAYARL